jgi:hypothetical protein
MKFYLYKHAGKFPDVTTRKLPDRELGPDLEFVGEFDERPDIDAKWIDASGRLVPAEVGQVQETAASVLARLVDHLSKLPAIGLPDDIKAWGTSHKPAK